MLTTTSSGGRTRTFNLLIQSQAICQLIYPGMRTWYCTDKIGPNLAVVRPEGFEPPTTRVKSPSLYR